MKRDLYLEKIEKWNCSARRKPLILEGARQVGKTWLMQEFAKTHYENVVYARFDKNRTLRSVFDQDFDIDRIVESLEILFHVKILAGKTILLFDEIQACRNALTSLKYFCEDRPDIPVIAAGSLLGLAYRDDDAAESEDEDSKEESTGFPVGKVDRLPVFPMSFVEFLCAMGEDALAEAIRNCSWAVTDGLRVKLEDWLKRYYVVGGMPEAVLVYSQTRSFDDVRSVQRNILRDYQDDISKHAPKTDVAKIKLCLNSIPVQLAKENKKFQYSVVKSGGRASQFQDPLEWLRAAGLVHIVKRAKVPMLPLDAYANCGFKVYLVDVGLLAAMSGLAGEIVLEGPRIFREFKGALTEQYVHQQLVAETDVMPYYWSTDDSRAEMDFVCQSGLSVLPIEVKAEENVKAKSLRFYVNRYRPARAVRVSMLPHNVQDVRTPEGVDYRLIDIPLYGVSASLQSLSDVSPAV